jgi:hypothetical protein
MRRRSQMDLAISLLGMFFLGIASNGTFGAVHESLGKDLAGC